MNNIIKSMNKGIENKLLTEDSELYRGIFWVVDEDNIEKNSDYCFKIITNADGSIISIDDSRIAKSGNTYNHELVWKSLPSKMTHGYPYNYYPRGRVEIRNGIAKIFLNGNINYEEVIDFIKDEFNLNSHNGIKKVQVIEDNSSHYLCHIDDGWKPAKR